MKLQSNILIKQFTEHITEQYSDLNEKQVSDICKSQFEYYSEQMASGKLPVIRAKYFGTFIAYPNRVKGMLKKLKEKYDKGNIEKENYFEMRTNLETYLENVKKD